MKAMIRLAASLVASGCLLAAPAAFAEGEACFNDIDCPGGGNVCGGDVCNWAKQTATPMGDKIFYCNPAGTQPKTMDGWCTTSADCKCAAQGATCKGTYCTFTKASDAPAGVGGSGGGGSGGASTAGAPSAGAPTAGAASAGAPSSAGTGASAPPADDGGCSVSAAGGAASGAAVALGLLGLSALFARRRR
jgi:MYXO-CTERM domain-containing protein